MTNTIFQGDVFEKLKGLSDASVDCVVTSPPYWALRDYCVDGQIGLEPTFEEYIKRLCDVFDEVKRVLKKEGTCWVNIGDTYGGSNCGYGQTEDSGGFQNVTRQTYYATSKKRPLAANIFPKSLLCIPFRFAIEMISRGWILRNTIIWHKPNCMPSSVRDRFTVDFEYLYFFVKNKKYYFEQQTEKHIWAEKDKRSIRKKLPQSGKILSGNNAINRVAYGKSGKNKRCVWKIETKPFLGAHFATFPEKLIETPIKACCPLGGVVLDPFFGSGTTGVVALKQEKHFIGIELNKEYVSIAEKRLKPYLEQRRLL